jgi:diguanylate cyclase (GGDEF)-like protein
VILEYSDIYEELLHASMWQLDAVAAAGLFTVVLVGTFGARLGDSISTRLKHLQAGVERVADGQYDVRLPIDASDEIGALQESFNGMAADLAASRANLLTEMEKEKASAQRIEHLAYYDNLTGLANRTLFSRLLEQEVLEARRYNRQLAVVLVDLDRFKNINDTLGHEAGDELLKEVALRLKSTLRASDALARLCGDEFVILLPNLNDAERVAAVAQKILAAVAQPYTSHDQEFWVTASVGISMFPHDGVDEPALMKHADIAMYQAKEDGKNTFAFYTEALNKHSIERLAFESSLRNALENEQFEVHYQPKVGCRTGRMTGVEALLRWHHPDLGWVSPSKFIPIAEETGLIGALGTWVLESACRQQVAWCTLGMPPFRMAVNLSARQFGDDNLLKDVGSVLTKAQGPRSQLVQPGRHRSVPRRPLSAERRRGSGRPHPALLGPGVAGQVLDGAQRL